MRKKKSRTTYSEILNVQKEIQTYHNVCNGKSKEYIYFSDWRDHIIECFSIIESERRLIDFKAFLRNRKRKAASLNGSTTTCIVFAITLLFEHFFQVDNSYHWISTICIIIILLWMIYKILIEAIFEGNTVCFYEDLLELLEERELQLKVEKEEKECPSSTKPLTKTRS